MNVTDDGRSDGGLRRRSVLRTAGAAVALPAAVPRTGTARARPSARRRGSTVLPGPGQRWERRFDAEPQVVAADGSLFVLAAGALHRVDPRSGESRWTTDGAADGDAFLHVTGGTAFVYGSGQIVAVDAADGTRLWGEQRNEVVVRIFRDGDRLFVGARSGRWWIHHVGRGTVLQSGAVDGSWVFGAGIHDGRLYVHPAGGPLSAVVIEDGTTAWTRDGAFHWSVVDDGRVYAGTTDETVEAVAAVDGQREWVFEGDAFQSTVMLPFSREEGLFVASTGHLFRLDPVDGSEQWSWSREAVILPYIEGIGADAVFTSIGGHVHAIDLNTGEERWSHYTRADQVTLDLLDDTLYAGANGDLTAYAPDGTERWRTSLADGGSPGLHGVGETIAARTGNRLVAFGAGAPPDPAIAVTTGAPTAGAPVGFSATGTTDPDTDVDDLSFEWQFGDGATGTGRTVEHAYDEPGSYAVTVTATERGGADGTETREVRVDPAPTGTATPTPTPDEEEATGAPGFGAVTAGIGIGAVAAWLANRSDDR